MRDAHWPRSRCGGELHRAGVLGRGKIGESPYNDRFFDDPLILANRANGDRTRSGPA